MSLKEQLTDDMKAAMRAKEAGKLATIRLILAEIKRKEVDEQIEVNEQQTVAIVEKMIKQRKDSITQFEAGNRPDLADIEKAELVVLAADGLVEAAPAELRLAIGLGVQRYVVRLRHRHDPLQRHQRMLQ